MAYHLTKHLFTSWRRRFLRKSLHPSLSRATLLQVVSWLGCLSQFPSNWSWRTTTVSWPPSLLPLLVWVPSYARPTCWCCYLVFPEYDPASVFSWSAVTFSLVLLFAMGLRLTWYPVNNMFCRIVLRRFWFDICPSIVTNSRPNPIIILRNQLQASQ